MCAGGAERRGRPGGWMWWKEAARSSPARRQPRHVLRLPRSRRGQQLPHVLLQRQDGKGGRLCSGAVERRAAAAAGQMRVQSAGGATVLSLERAGVWGAAGATCSGAGGNGGRAASERNYTGVAWWKVCSLLDGKARSGSVGAQGTAARRRSRTGPLPGGTTPALSGPGTAHRGVAERSEVRVPARLRLLLGI